MIFELDNVSFSYPGSDSPALDRIDLRVARGQCLLVTGESGSGKSTLARVMGGLIPEFQGGELSGSVRFSDRALADWGTGLRRHVGMVFQDPERQIIASTVRREIATGMENLGIPRGEMRRSMAEVTGWLGLEPLLDRHCHELSGGEKQKTVIGAILAMAQTALVLDEPTSQLDPMAAAEVFEVLRRLNQDLGLTLILIEQHLDGCLSWANRVVALDHGRVACDLPPRDYARWALDHGANIPQTAIPFPGPDGRTLLPLTVPEARAAIASLPPIPAPCPSAPPTPPSPQKTVIRARGAHFAYGHDREALRGIDIDVSRGEILCLLGGNGAGKSTLLAMLLGLLRPNSGEISVFGKDPAVIPPAERLRRIGYLSQNPDHHLAHETVAEEIAFSRTLANLDGSAELQPLLDRLHVAPLAHRHPHDLSAGERRRVALASTLATDPDLLLLDEPTRGLSERMRAALSNLLADLVAGRRRTIIMATQDFEFAADIAHRAALMFDGEIVASGPPGDILEQGLFFSTAWGRALRGRSDCRGILTRRQAHLAFAPRLTETQGPS